MVWTIAAAQVLVFPPSNGDGRFRASAAAILRHRSAYSAFRCSAQNWSVKATIASNAGRRGCGTASPVGRVIGYTSSGLRTSLSELALDLVQRDVVPAAHLAEGSFRAVQLFVG